LTYYFIDRALRFEDFLHDTDNSIGKLLDFVGLKIQKEMKAFLTAHRIGTSLQVAGTDAKQQNGNPVQRRFAPIGDRPKKKPDLQVQKIRLTYNEFP
jgi:hypothetical protein